MKRKKINCEIARNICIVQTLAKLGHFPKRESEKEAWFLSPIRQETQASFKVSKTLNRWYDHGEGIGGNLIDLLTCILKCPVKEVLEFLRIDFTDLSFQQQIPLTTRPKSKIQVLHVQHLDHPGLLEYLKNRNINLTIARSLCKEIHYQINHKKYFSIGLKNQSGGWELRNKYFKSATSPKDITVQNKNKLKLFITEGMFDILSLLTWNLELLSNHDFIVLNSVSFTDRAIDISKKYQKVFLYLDNDIAGKKSRDKLLTALANAEDQSNLYENFNDVNEWLVDQK